MLYYKPVLNSVKAIKKYKINIKNFKMFLCPKCDIQFSIITNLRKHIQVQHSGECYNLKCKNPGCFRIFTSIGTYIKHIESHLENKSADLVTKIIYNDNNVLNADEKVISSLDAHFISCHLDENNVDNFNINSPKENTKEDTPSFTHKMETDCDENSFNEQKYVENVSKSVDILVAHLFSLMILPRSLVGQLLKIFYDFYNKNFACQLELVNSLNFHGKVNNIVNVMKNVFNNHSTEHIS